MTRQNKILLLWRANRGKVFTGVMVSILLSMLKYTGGKVNDGVNAVIEMKHILYDTKDSTHLLQKELNELQLRMFDDRRRVDSIINVLDRLEKKL